MKKVKTIIFSVFVLGILAINLSIDGNRTNGSLSLSSVEKANADNLEEVVILCNTGGHGYCYDARYEAPYFTWNCMYTGCTLDYCL